MNLLKRHLTQMKLEKAYEGFGYLGHENRNEWSDEKLLEAANALKLSCKTNPTSFFKIRSNLYE